MNDKNSVLTEVYSKAVVHHQKGSLEAAKNLYKKILEQLPNHINTQSNLGGLYAQTGELEKAMHLLQNVLRIEPNNVNANSNLGIAFNKLTEYQKAIDCHKKVLQIESNNADAYNNLGINYKQLGETDLAKSHLYKAIEINPNHANAYNNLGTLLKSLGEHEKALSTFKKALSIEPNFFKAQTNLANTYLTQQKDFEKAVTESHKALGTYQEVSNVYNQSVPLFRLKHDVGQAEYLKSKNYEINGLNEFYEIGKEILNRKENQENESNFNKEILLKDSEIQSLLPFYKTQYIYQTPKLSGSVLNPDKDWNQVEMEYLNSEKQIIYIDNFLSKEAIKELREFSLVSKVWIHQMPNKYLGAFSDSGFINPLHIQLGTDLQKKLPKLFGKYNIGKFWGFKYDTTLGKGIGIHADFAYLNLNFWITPDEYNNDKNRGGLKVYDAPAPEDWSFDRYNTNAKEIYKFLEEKKAKCENIPYQFNRAVLFNSAYFHETDKIDFKSGYESRRINITYLFGTRKIKKIN